MRLRGKKVLVSRRDVWNCDVTLSPIIAAVLKKFLEESSKSEFFGYPSSMRQEVGIDGPWYEGISKEQEEACVQKWKEIIQDMIFAFEYDEHDSNEYWNEYAKSLSHEFIKTEDTPKNFRQMIVHCDESKRKLYEDRREELEARREKGMQYFAKYYTSLWW